MTPPGFSGISGNLSNRFAPLFTSWMILSVRFLSANGLLPLVNSFVKQIFNLTVYASEFVVCPLLQLFHHVGAHPKYKWFLFSHNYVAATAACCFKWISKAKKASKSNQRFCLAWTLKVITGILN